MRRHRALALLLIGAVAAAAACAPLVGAEFDGYWRGSDPLETDAADAVADDTNEPGTDGGQADADASWCNLHRGDAAFCDDFDEHDDLNRYSTVQESGTVAVDHAKPQSPAFALLASADAIEDGGLTQSYVVAYTSESEAISTVDLRFDVRVQAPFNAPKIADQLVALVVFEATSKSATKWMIGIGVNPSGRYYLTQHVDKTDKWDPVWFEPVGVDVPRDYGTLRLHVAIKNINNAPVSFYVGDTLKTSTATAPLLAGRVSVLLGIPVSGGGPRPAFDTRIDNVVIDTQ